MKQLKVGEYLTFHEVRELLDDGDTDLAELLYGDGIRQTAKNAIVLSGERLIYETVYRVDQNHAWQYMGLCEKGERANRDPASAKKIFVISQFASNEVGTREENTRFAAALAKIIYTTGRMPVVPHLYFPTFMDDSIEIEREWGILAGHELMRGCSEVEVWMVDHWLSDGMEADIDFAVNELGLNPTFHSVSKETRDQVISGTPWKLVEQGIYRAEGESYAAK